MKPDLSPAGVAARLSALRARATCETLEQARARLDARDERPPLSAGIVARRLDELRALLELSEYLRSADRE